MSPETPGKTILPYAICCVQANWEMSPNEATDASLKGRNLEMMCDYIDTAMGGPHGKSPVKLFCFPEFSIGGVYGGSSTVEEVKKYQCITIPGPETDILAAKAKQHGVYIAAVNNENDPALPDYFTNTAFILNPQGKLILKYRKLNCYFGASPHDVFDKYKNPVTKKQDFFPVVETKIGRLACFICADLGIPEIPKMYALKGADVVLHLSSGYSWELAQALVRARAVDNTVYVAHENWAGMAVTSKKLGATKIVTNVNTRGGGGSMIVDYNGNVIAEGQGMTPQLVMGMVDVMALRREREGWRWPNPFAAHGNALSMTRTELYAPYYNKTIFPPNKVTLEGPMKHSDDESVTRRRNEALSNLKKFYDFYSEDEI